MSVRLPALTERSTHKLIKKHRNCSRFMLAIIIYIIILVFFSKILVIVVSATMILIFGYGCCIYICTRSAEIDTDTEEDIEYDEEIAHAIRENDVDNRRIIEATIVEIPTILNFENIITPTAAQIVTAVPVRSPVNENIYQESITTIEL